MVGPEVVERALAEIGIGFMLAPMHHPAMRHVMPVRAELGTRTIFNLLGPLTNPAAVRRQLTGAFSPRGDPADGRDAGALGSDRAWLVHGADGIDEISITGETYVAELRDGAVREFASHPEDAGLPVHPFAGDPRRRAGRERRGAARAARRRSARPTATRCCSTPRPRW